MMISPDILKRIKEIQIKTRRILNNAMVGDVRAAQKGFGLEFDQLREYVQGDDIRFIDWKATARAQKFLVRQYFEERNRTIMLLVDCSGPTFFGSTNQRKYDLIAEIACVLTLVAEYGNDAVGLVLFSDEIKKVIPPGKGNIHSRMIMQEVLSMHETNAAANMDEVYKWLARSKKSLCFIISDFIADHPMQSIKRASYTHELIAVRCLDPIEIKFPSVGLLETVGMENNVVISLDVTKNTDINKLLHDRIEYQNKLFKQHQIDYLDLVCGQPAINNIVNFFRKRMMY
jgi:uncharacterized protein (DUF58 family)